MNASVKICTLFGIEIRIHVTFLLLVILVAPGGVRRAALVAAVFCFVTMHELCHALVARRFGIPVRSITLLPIGGVAAMGKIPDKPAQELAVSLAGPLSNLAVIALFYFPAKLILGPAALFHPLSTETWRLTFAYMYWINLLLAGFNLLPAFPMDGGRVLRALLAIPLGMRRATRIAVVCGHIFALIFAYFGLMQFNLVLIVIAVFIYVAASGEEAQVSVTETLKKFRVRDILPVDFIAVTSSTTLAKVLEIIFHSHQEDFPVVDKGALAGFVTRQDIMNGIHRAGTDVSVGEVMRRHVPHVRDSDALLKVQDLMRSRSMRALPVMRDGAVVGVITFEDIARVYALASERGQ